MSDIEHSEGATLGVNFARAQRQLHSINNSKLASNSEEYQKQVKSLIELLKQCLKQVTQLSLFSKNETTEDYSTNELKLILINAYLGESLQKLNSTDGRVQILEEAQSCYKEFLSVCQMLGINTKVITESDESQANTKRATNPGLSRMQKIERFKLLRTMQKSVGELEAKLNANGGDEEDEDMEEVEREYAIKLLELKVHQVIDDLDILKSEVDMARQMEEMNKLRSTSGDDKKENNSNKDWRLDSTSYRGIDPTTGKPIRPLFNEKGQPMQPFVLTNDRQRIKQGVFKPGWALPTMTVDEYLKQEQERGNIISGGGKEPDAKPEIDDNDHEALDKETMKQREWDDFKDDNPKGWGNRGGNRG